MSDASITDRMPDHCIETRVQYSPWFFSLITQPVGGA